jgi:hypothetical protein
VEILVYRVLVNAFGWLLGSFHQKQPFFAVLLPVSLIFRHLSGRTTMFFEASRRPTRTRYYSPAFKPHQFGRGDRIESNVRSTLYLLICVKTHKRLPEKNIYIDSHAGPPCAALNNRRHTRVTFSDSAFVCRAAAKVNERRKASLASA